MANKKKLLALLLMLTMVLSACTPGGNSAQGDGNEGQTEEGGEATNVSSDGMDSIIRMTQDWPTYYDPAVGSSFSDAIALINVYDPLVFSNIDGSIDPHIATGWEVSEDGLTYTFTIRDDVKFHSGNLMTAGDVAFSMNRMLEIGEGFAYLYKGVVKEAVATDDTTVVMTLEKPFGPFIDCLIRFFIVEEELVMANLDTSVNTYGEYGDYGKTWLLVNDAGSGPYKTTEFQLDEYLLAEKFDDYFLGFEENTPQYFRLSGATEAVSVRTAVANKELEITDELQPLENYQTMDSFDGVDVVAYENGNNMNIMMNTKVAPTDDINFRKAIAHAFDYDTVLEEIYPDAKRSYGPVPSSVPGHNPNIEPYTYDVEKAREYLAQSPYADDPSMMTIQLTWCAEVPEQEKIALLMQSNLAEVGINVEITKKPFGSMIADAQTVETTPHVSFVNISPSYFEAGAMLRTRYHSSSTGTWEQMEWLMDDQLDTWIDDALSSTDREERFEKYMEIQEYINELCPTVWVFDWVEKRACQTAYVDWPPYQMTQDGITFKYPMGYSLYVRDMKIYPENR